MLPSLNFNGESCFGRSKSAGAKIVGSFNMMPVISQALQFCKLFLHHFFVFSAGVCKVSINLMWMLSLSGSFTFIC